MIDKPAGVTSHWVVDQLRKITGIRRVGHAGTLDPLATGLLIILVGRTYTKQQVSFLKQAKEYLCTAKLGITTDTYDLDGQTTNQADWSQITDLTLVKIDQALDSFRGKITQTAPPFSAIKQNGKKLYELARDGKIKAEDLPKRQVVINQLKIIDFNKDQSQQSLEITFKISVSSGTYIRSVVHELGQQLKIGAIVTQLKRTKIGKYRLEKAFQLDQKTISSPTIKPMVSTGQ